MEGPPASPPQSSGETPSFYSNDAIGSSLASETLPELQHELIQWLRLDHLGSSLRRKILKKTEVIILKVDVMELLSSFPTLAGEIVRCPENVGISIIKHIVSHNMKDLAIQDVLLQSRIHIRWQAVPIPVFKSVREVLECSRGPCPLPGYPVQILGVVCEVSSLQKRTYIRRVRCQACGVEQLLYEEKSGTPPCCCEASFEEDIASRVEVAFQVQENQQQGVHAG